MSRLQKREQWRNTRNTERISQPPPQTRHIAKVAIASLNRPSRRRKSCKVPKLLFDSFLQPLVEGARSTGSGTRQMLYRADPYQIDLQIETGSDQRTLVITGQVLDLRQSEFSGRDVLVVISNLRGEVALTTTDQFGEFRKEISDSGDLELFFLGLTDNPFTLAIGDPHRR